MFIQGSIQIMIAKLGNFSQREHTHVASQQQDKKQYITTTQVPFLTPPSRDFTLPKCIYLLSNITGYFEPYICINCVE